MTEAVFERKGYKITELLSAGTFKQVYNAVKIGTNELYAVKVIDLDIHHCIDDTYNKFFRQHSCLF
jgi:serine/threonine protein kinase